MENVVEKLGFFDFFNHIIVGMFTIIGCFSITYQFGWNISKGVFSYLVERGEVNALFLVLCLFSIITVSYILGLLCHESFSLTDKKNKTVEKLITELFTKNSCIDNKKKRDRYKTLATNIIKSNKIPNTENSSRINWDFELSNYYYTYCLYQLQIRGLNKKTEKLRDIEGLAKSFCVSGIMLLAILFLAGLGSWNTFLLPEYAFWIEIILLLFFSLIFNEYRKKALKNRIRMTLALFEAVFDKEKLDESK